MVFGRGGGLVFLGDTILGWLETIQSVHAQMLGQK